MTFPQFRFILNSKHPNLEQWHETKTVFATKKLLFCLLLHIHAFPSINICNTYLISFPFWRLFLCATMPLRFTFKARKFKEAKESEDEETEEKIKLAI